MSYGVDHQVGWIFKTHGQDQLRRQVARVYFAAIANREEAIDAVCAQFQVDIRGVEITALADVPEFKEKVRWIKPGEADLVWEKSPL